ncbi:MAG: hypothetical protein NVS3B26_25120 [Mycobacteriales bacterium]
MCQGANAPSIKLLLLRHRKATPLWGCCPGADAGWGGRVGRMARGHSRRTPGARANDYGKAMSTNAV